MTHFS